MLEHNLITPDGILVLEPTGRLSKADFVAVAAEVDPYIDQHGPLAGLLISAKSFPGWENFGALVGHLRFVREHHRKIRRVAMLSDNRLLAMAPKVAAHFIDADVRHFAAGQREQALRWLRSGTDGTPCVAG